MTIPVNPMPQETRLYTNITPFTVRDNATYATLLEDTRQFINTKLVPFINENVSKLDAAWVEQTTTLIESWNVQSETLIETWETQSAALLNQVESIAESLGNNVQEAVNAKDLAEAARDIAEMFASQAEEVQDVAISVIAGDLESVTRNLLDSLYFTKTNMGEIEGAIDTATKTFHMERIGLVSDGITDNADAIENAFNNIPDGYTVKMPKGDYALSRTVTVPVSGILDIDMSDSRIVNNANGLALDFVGEYSTPLAVTSMTETVLSPPSDGSAWTAVPRPGIEISVNGPTPNWKRGDIVKVIADDPIPGQRDLGTTNENTNSLSRMGQHMTVWNVTTTRIILIGALREFSQYSANIRVALLPRENRVIVRNLSLSMPAEGFAPEATSNRQGVRFMNLYHPVLENSVIEGTNGPALTFNSCFRYSARNIDIGVTRNKVGSVAVGGAIYGYGIIDIGSEYGVVDNYHAGHVRHAFTDDSARGATNREPGRYGRTYGTIVSNSSCDASSAAAWDTHTQSDSVSFNNVSAYGCEAGISLRGIRHSVSNFKAVECRVAVRVNDEESALGWSWGHVFNGVSIDGCDTAFNLAVHNGGPLNGQREVRPLSISNVVARNVRGSAVFGRCVTVYWDNVLFHIVSDSVNAQPLFYAIRANEHHVNGITFDLREAVNITVPVFGSLNGSVIKANGFEVMFETVSSRPEYLINSTSGNDSLINGVLSSPIESIIPNTAVLSWITNQAKLSGDRSGSRPGFAVFDQSDIESGSNKWLNIFNDIQAPTLTIRVNLNANAVLPVLPPGFPGQRLFIRVFSGNSSTLTIQHGSPGNTQLIGSSAKAVGSNQKIELVNTGNGWMQTFPV